MAELKAFLNRIYTLVQPYIGHAGAQAIAWEAVLTHNLTKAESAAFVVAAAAVTSAAKKLSAWLQAKAA